MTPRQADRWIWVSVGVTALNIALLLLGKTSLVSAIFSVVAIICVGVASIIWFNIRRGMQ